MPDESALVVLIPESEALVKSFRDKYDPSAAKGMPAHVTLLFPFKLPQEIDDAVIGKLQSRFARFTPFDCAFVSIKRFPQVAYLGLEDEKLFRDLTMSIWKSFPETPPFESIYDEVIPHLTIANVVDEKKLDHISAEFMRVSGTKLPIHAKASNVALMDNKTGRWQVRVTFKLGTI